MVGRVEGNRNFRDQVVELVLKSGLNSTDVIRVLAAILVQIVAGASLRRRAFLRAQIYNRLVDHMESIREGREPVLHSAGDAAPDLVETIRPSAFFSQRGAFTP